MPSKLTNMSFGYVPTGLDRGMPVREPLEGKLPRVGPGIKIFRCERVSGRN